MRWFSTRILKPYLLTTGILFGLMAAVHIWRAIAEWPKQGINLEFVVGMAALIALPGLLSCWAFRLLRNLSANRAKLTSEKE
ncbi:MAG: hypothetical protein JWQ71_434 [Pedosphaera sp.]|nr:hypothetical protein [Pedosphaera sp.]